MKKILLLLTSLAIFLLAISCSGIVIAAEIKNQNRDCVVMLHGLLRHSDSMEKIAHKLRDEKKFTVLNLDYPAPKFRIEELIEIIHPQISEFEKKCEGRLNFVAHSIGGLVTRAYIHKFHPKNLGKVVMLGTPNQGSEEADVASKLFLVKDWYKKVYGPAGAELITDQSQFKNIFGEVSYELHIIAGNLSRDPLAWIIFKSENDGKVTVDRTKLDGMKSHTVFKVDHGSMLVDDAVIERVGRVLMPAEASS